MKRGTILGLAIIGVCVAGFILVAVVGIAALAKRGPIAAPQAQAAKGDPWPECAAIREYLRVHAHEASSVEVVEWNKRWHFDGLEASPSLPKAVPGDPPDVFLFRVRIRARNTQGAMENQVWIFKVRQGEVSVAGRG